MKNKEASQALEEIIGINVSGNLFLERNSKEYDKFKGSDYEALLTISYPISESYIESYDEFESVFYGFLGAVDYNSPGSTLLQGDGHLGVNKVIENETATFKHPNPELLVEFVNKYLEKLEVDEFSIETLEPKEGKFNRKKKINQVLG